MQSFGGGNRKRLLLIAGLVGAAAIGAGLWALAGGGKSEPKAEAPPPLVTVIRASSGSLRSKVVVTGTLGARNEMPIGPEGEGGRIAAVLVEAGDRVKRGQLLARIDPLMAESQQAAVQAGLDELRATAVAYEAEYARALKAANVFSVEELERRRTVAVSAQAKVKAAEAQLAEAHTRWARTQILAPADGLVLTRNAEVGQIAVPGGAVLFRLAKEGAIEMHGQVAEQDVPLLQAGQAVEVYLNGVAAPFAGKVWQIGAIIDSTTRQGTVRITLASNDQNLRPGAFARAEVSVADVAGMVLPQTAVQSDDQGSFVLVVGNDQRLQRRAVIVRGAHREGLLIDSGVASGEAVIATAGAFLRVGEAVQVADNASSTNAAKAMAAP